MPQASPSFEKLFDELEALDALLDEGPGDDSQVFLDEVRGGLKRADAIALGLDVEDVDNEFTEDQNAEETGE